MRHALQTADETNQNLYNMLEVPKAGIRSQILSNESSNSLDSIILEEMTTIPDLVNIIDGYIDNPRTDRRILVNQIKRATRQIHQWDLRQTDLNNVLNDLNMMITAYNNERNTCQQYFLELQQCRIRIDTAEIEGRGINITDAAGGPPTGKDHAKGLLRGCMRGTMLE
ncbi:2627_t:CDS:2 [Diversispora eburnea]|uniref:2627_t:CDS:1 n=1 Tax=Diversispora eburnea TaxID=1213867 RepID=A0A9N9CWB4_9GLOM|nr:2627_t:CDS:2 [Diversispora eburnea]